MIAMGISLLFKSKKLSPLQFLILLVLLDGPKYGYEILILIRNEFDKLWEIKTGSLYPSLKSLETKELISSEITNNKKFYDITNKGKTFIFDLGERLYQEYELNEQFFKTIIKYFPGHLIKDISRTFILKSIETGGSSQYLQLVIDKIGTEEIDIEMLLQLERTLNLNLEIIEGLISDTRE